MYHTCQMGGGFPYIVSEFVSDNDYKRIIVCKFCQNLKKTRYRYHCITKHLDCEH